MFVQVENVFPVKIRAIDFSNYNFNALEDILVFNKKKAQIILNTPLSSPVTIQQRRCPESCAVMVSSLSASTGGNYAPLSNLELYSLCSLAAIGAR